MGQPEAGSLSPYAGILRIEWHVGQVKNFSRFFRTRQLKVPRQMERAQHENSIPIRVNFVPDQPMTGRLRMRMMIVMPAFSPAQHGDPKTVSGRVVRAKAP